MWYVRMKNVASYNGETVKSEWSNVIHGATLNAQMVLSFELTGEGHSADYVGGQGHVSGCHKNDGKYIYNEVDMGIYGMSYRYTHEDDLNKSSNVRYFYHTNNQEWKFNGYGYCSYDNFTHSNNIWSRDLIHEKLNPCTSPMINSPRIEDSFGGGKISNCEIGWPPRGYEVTEDTGDIK